MVILVVVEETTVHQLALRLPLRLPLQQVQLFPVVAVLHLPLPLHPLLHPVVVLHLLLHLLPQLHRMPLMLAVTPTALLLLQLLLPPPVTVPLRPLLLRPPVRQKMLHRLLQLLHPRRLQLLLTRLAPTAVTDAVHLTAVTVADNLTAVADAVHLVQALQLRQALLPLHLAIANDADVVLDQVQHLQQLPQPLLPRQ